MSHWWAGIPAAEITVSCGGYTNTVRWEAGELIAVDHGDPEGEATPVLAGETLPCLELLRAWSRRRDDPHVLTLASRGPTDPLDIDLERLRFDYREPRRRTEEQTMRLLATGGQLPDRLQATTAAIWTRRLRTGHAALETARPQLEAALYARVVLRTLRAWLGEPRLAIKLTMIGPTEQRRIVRTAEGVDVSLPFSWLPEVRMRGLAVTVGRLCIAAETADGSSWILHTLGPDLANLSQLTIATR